MLRERLTWLRLFHLGADAAGLVLTLVAVAVLRAWVGSWWSFDIIPGPPLLQRVAVADQLSLSWMLVPCWLAVLAWRGRYRRIGLGADGSDLASVAAASLLALVGFVALVYLLRIETVSRTVVIGFGLAVIPALSLSHRLALLVAKQVGQPLRLRIVGQAEHAAPLLAAMAQHPEWGVQLVERVDTVGSAVADGVDEVVVLGPADADDLSVLAASCEELGVPLSIEASFLGTRIAQASVRELHGTTLLTFTSTPTRSAELVFKRIFDVVGATVMLVVSLPLVVVAAIAVRATDGGPALFVQERVGRYGRRFRMLKLRTMRVGAEDERAMLAADNVVVGPAFKLSSDPRITAIGRWLRRTSIDELPQLFNVLRGEMSLVGPRPPLPEEVAQYARWQRRRLSMRPGLTGLWQVTARDEPDVSRWISLDLQYIDEWSLLGDLGLMVRTIPAVLVGKGAR